LLWRIETVTSQEKRMGKKNWLRRAAALAAWVGIAFVSQLAAAGAPALTPSPIPLANIDRALSNVALSLSVEFPTGDTSSYGNHNGGLFSSTYDGTKTYYGYFDPTKCYIYNVSDVANGPYFVAQACGTGYFKGNFLNWASMTNLDQFRRVMTGGNRSVDTNSLTILRRAYNDMNNNSANYFPSKTATTPDSGDSSRQYAYRNQNMGDKMLMQPGASVTLTNFTLTYPSRPSTTGSPDLQALAVLPCGKTTDAASTSLNPSTNSLYGYYKGRNTNHLPPWTCFHMRVQVCDTSAGVENNCTDYTATGGGHKPEGLMQQYNLNMRFAALGYVFDNDFTPQGGVLRARMKSVGPTIADPLNGTLPNLAGEWDPRTGIYVTSPDPADAAASSVANSGVMNYLNKFGYSSGGYKGYDTMAEMYYETLRYLRHMSPTTQAISGLTAPMYDGFPIINFSAIPDPVTSACQRNFDIAIGDVNNWCDTRLPGGSTNTQCNGAIPSGDTVNFANWTDSVGNLEGLGNLSTQWVSSGRKTGYLLSGAAYWAHANDMRPDRAAQRPAGQIQNLTTYTIDVLEPWNGNIFQTGATKTQFWLAAKYGGFNTLLACTDRTSPHAFDPNYAADCVTPSSLSWNTPNPPVSPTNVGVPDNWFAGNDPQTMQQSLRTVFDKIIAAGTSGDGAAPATSGVSLETATKVYYASYTLANGGQGSLKACRFATSANACAASPDWDAAQWLTPGAPRPYTYQTFTSRQIITRSGGGGVPLHFSNLAVTDKTRMNINPATQAADAPTPLGSLRVDYLRGDSSAEIANGGPFRSRFASKLGDIVGSGPIYVGPPNALFVGSLFLGYADFINAEGNRKPVLYAGANDGLLHAFDAATGQELLAYLPGYFLQADPGKSSARIAALTNPTYTHQFFVDATPMVGDVLFGSTWKTILVGAYGAGGKGFFALDVTDPTRFSESNAGALSLWELSDATDADIGYSFNQPVSSPISGQALQFALVHTATGSRWAVIVGNGFGSTSGKAALLFIDPQTGSVFNKVVVESASGINGLATPFPVDTQQTGVIDTIWAGDLLGTLWRVSWNGTSWGSTAAFVGSATQPITSAPAAVPHSSVQGAWAVVFGTGKYIERTDYKTMTTQSLYGIVDAFSSVSVTKADLVQQTILAETTPNPTTGDFFRHTSANAVDFRTKKGWFLDLPNTNGERSISNPVIPADTGIALMGSYVPATACLAGTGFVNILDAFTGAAVVDATGSSPGDYSISGSQYLASWGGQGLGIPYFSSVISSGSTVAVKVGGGRIGFTSSASWSEVDLSKTFVRGKRFSWRQIR
jgi:type IV pilus assembly protein PilY1